MVLNRINQDSDRKRVGRNFLSLSTLQVVNVLLPLITLPYLVRVLGTERFGLVIFAQSFAVFFSILVDFGFNVSATREVAVNRSNRSRVNEIFSNVMAIKGVLLIFAFLLLLAIVFLIPRLAQDWSIYLLSFGVVAGQALFPQWLFQGVEKMSVITIVNLMAKLTFTILILVVIRKEEDYLLVPVFNSVGFILSGCIGLIWALRIVNPVKPRLGVIKVQFQESFQLFISNLATSLYSYSNVIILGALTNNASVGIYASMEKLVLAVKSLYTPFLQALFPYTASKKRSQVIQQVNSLIGPLSVIGIVVSVVMLLFAENILDLIYNDPLITGFSDVMRILSCIGLLSALSMLFNYLFLTSLKKYKERMKIMIYAGVFNVLTAGFLVTLYGIYGMAISTVLTEVLLLLMGAFYFYKIKNEEISHSPDGGS